MFQKNNDFHPYTGEIYKVHDPPLSNNDRCSMLHDIAYTVAENVGQCQVFIIGATDEVRKKLIVSVQLLVKFPLPHKMQKK